MRSLLVLSVLLVIFSCNSPSAGSVDLSGYTTVKLDGGVTKAYKETADGTVVEEGYVSNGMMNGVWLTYHPEGRIKSMTTYSNNLKSGPHLEFNTRGQMELKAYFNNGVLNGPYGKFKSGRYLSQSNYKNGKLDGVHQEYFESGRNAGKVQKYVEFKDGQQHGKLEYYDEEGNTTLSYQYENGKKMTGGIIEK